MVSYRWRQNLRVDNWSSSNAQLQGAIYEPTARVWLLSQGLPVPGYRGDQENTRIHCYDRSGAKKLWTMTLTKFGHGSVIGARQSAAGNLWVWVPCDTYDAQGNTTKTQVARVLGRAGTLNRDSKNVFVYNLDGLGKNLSPFAVGPHPHMFLRYGRSADEVYYLVNEDDVKHETPRYAEKWIASKAGRPGPFQGCIARAKEKDLFVLSGSTNETNRIDYHVDGRLKGRYDVKIDDLRAVLRSRVESVSSIEPEGLCFIGPQMVMGARCGPTGAKRTFALVDVDL